MPMKNFEDMRKFKRYEGRDDKAAFVAIRPAFTKIGALKDMSLSGLGFKYSLREQEKPLSDKEDPISLDLFISNNGFYLPNLKCKLAYDKFAKNGSWLSPSGMHFRQCGLKFDEPTEEQKEQINVFLRDYAVGSA
jgi:hypothetical protein